LIFEPVFCKCIFQRQKVGNPPLIFNFCRPLPNIISLIRNPILTHNVETIVCLNVGAKWHFQGKCAVLNPWVNGFVNNGIYQFRIWIFPQVGSVGVGGVRLPSLISDFRKIYARYRLNLNLLVYSVSSPIKCCSTRGICYTQPSANNGGIKVSKVHSYSGYLYYLGSSKAGCSPHKSNFRLNPESKK